MTTTPVVPPAVDAPRRDPAPGDVELIRQFVNTFDVESGEDHIGSPAALTDWLAERRLVPARRRMTDADLATATAFREALRQALAANAGHADAAGARQVLDHLASHYPMRVRLDGGPRLEPSGGRGIEPALAHLVATMYDAMRLGTWERLKVCRNDECQWAFYDHSRNHSGTWCRMAACGNLMKARAFRARHAQPAEG